MKKKEIFIQGAKNLISELKTEIREVNSKTGSVTEFLFGEGYSNQSVVIKFGNRWEKYLNDFAKNHGNNLDFDCPSYIRGHQIDYIVKIKNGNTFPAESHTLVEVSVNYDEMKCNVALDSEKLPATIEKILDVKKGLQEIYSDEISKNVGILHAIVWEKGDAPASHSYYRRFEENKIPVKTLKDYFKQIGIDFTREDFYSLKRDIQSILR